MTCSVCKEILDIDTNQHEEGDFIRCAECGELLTLEVTKGKYKLVTDQEKKFEEMQDLDEEFEDEEDSD